MANREKNFSPHGTLVIIITLLLCIFIMVLAGLSFGWEHPIIWKDPNYIVDQELLGTFGDFIGGVAGTFVAIASAILLYWTFKHQQEVTSSDEDESKIKRFNVLFFELLHLYQSEVDELCGERRRISKIEKDKQTKKLRIHTDEIQYNNKDFFDEEKLKLQTRYKKDITSFEESRNYAIPYYMAFYTAYRSKIAAYFRTLYRIYELIDATKLIDDDQKRRYAKIIRAQLTESELFFILYNARTPYGEPFIKYINTYNILKHLPAFELLEFSHWHKKTKILEREVINIIYISMREELKKLFLNHDKNLNKTPVLPEDTSPYQISCHRKRAYIIELKLSINNAIIPDRLSITEFQQVLECFLKEIFIYSNFAAFNNENDLEISSTLIDAGNDKTIIDCYVKNTKFKEIYFFAPKKARNDHYDIS